MALSRICAQVEEEGRVVSGGRAIKGSAGGIRVVQARLLST